MSGARHQDRNKSQRKYKQSIHFFPASCRTPSNAAIRQPGLSRRTPSNSATAAARFPAQGSSRRPEGGSRQESGLAKSVPLPGLRLGYHHVRMLWVHEPQLETFAEARLTVCPRHAKALEQRSAGLAV